MCLRVELQFSSTVGEVQAPLESQKLSHWLFHSGLPTWHQLGQRQVLVVFLAVGVRSEQPAVELSSDCDLEFNSRGAVGGFRVFFLCKTQFPKY